MAKATRRDLAEPSLSGLDDDDEVTREDAPLEAEESSASLRNETRNERMHVRVQLPFHAVIDGRRYAGHDLSTSGFSTAKRPAIDADAPVQCDIYIRCNGFRAAIPTTARMLGERDDNRGGRFEFTAIADAEATILRRLVRSHLAGVHLTPEQLAAKEDPPIVRERVKQTVSPPNPAPSLLRSGGTLAAIGLTTLENG